MSVKQNTMQRVHVIISGDVQGVGFRAWTKAQARQLGIAGWVKNREDGAVEVVGEGVREVLEKLVERCHAGPEVSWVEHVTVEWLEGAGEFAGFEVLY